VALCKQEVMNQEPRTKNYEQPALGAGFTIIELLVVISIIAILIGFAIPSFLPVKEKARQRKAVITAKHLELAYSEYFSQFQKWPGSDGDVKGSLLSELTGSAGICFFEIGTNTENTFYDPYGSPDQGGGFYRVAFDNNFDNKVTPGEGAPGNLTISKSVIVWDLHTYTNSRDEVITITNKSWE